MLNLILVRSRELKKNYLVFLKVILNKYIKKVHLKSNTLYIKILGQHLYPLALFLKNHTTSQFKTLVDIISFDRPGTKPRFSMVYNFLSLDLNYRVKVELRVLEKCPIISTLVPLYSSSGWLEREVWDLFGIFFVNNLDLRRILTDYGFVGYPLRKDFPLTGFVEVVYDDTEKQIVYKTLDLSQDFRNFRFKNSWKLYN